jgi:hypothetical protein
LKNIALISTIKEDVIVTQKTCVGMAISEEDYGWMKHSVSNKMPMEFYGSRIASWFQRTSSFTVRS